MNTINSLIANDTHNDRVQVLEDVFVDCAGKSHRFMIAAVSRRMEGYAGDCNTYQYDEVNIEKCLSIGISVCNPADKYDTRIAYLQATGRARKNVDRMLFVTRSGMINTKMVQALLEQEAEFLKNNPDFLIKGYSDFEKRWMKREQKSVSGLL